MKRLGVLIGLCLVAAISFYLTQVLLLSDPQLTNLALHKPATMSSVAVNTTASIGTDGITDGDKNWFHTEADDKPWWTVDLQNEYTVHNLEVFNRTDCCGERSKTLTVLLSTDGKDWRQAYKHDGSPFGALKGDKQLKVKISPASARYVRIQLTDRGYLHLSEIRVFGN